MSRTPHPVHPPLSELIALEAAASGLSFLANQPLSSVLAVSYTHLTLPTILLV